MRPRGGVEDAICPRGRAHLARSVEPLVALEQETRTGYKAQEQTGGNITLMNDVWFRLEQPQQPKRITSSSSSTSTSTNRFRDSEIRRHTRSPQFFSSTQLEWRIHTPLCIRRIHRRLHGSMAGKDTPSDTTNHNKKEQRASFSL